MVFSLLQIPYIHWIHVRMYGSGQPYNCALCEHIVLRVKAKTLPTANTCTAMPLQQDLHVRVYCLMRSRISCDSLLFNALQDTHVTVYCLMRSKARCDSLLFDALQDVHVTFYCLMRSKTRT